MFYFLVFMVSRKHDVVVSRIPYVSVDQAVSLRIVK